MVFVLCIHYSIFLFVDCYCISFEDFSDPFLVFQDLITVIMASLTHLQLL